MATTITMGRTMADVVAERLAPYAAAYEAAVESGELEEGLYQAAIEPEGGRCWEIALRPGMCAGFPAGTVSGAPKIRAMEIIDELETTRRGFYAGGIGYIGADGNLDTYIGLRTGLVKDGTLYVQAGGGVVADSDPEAEYQESCNKAKALLHAAEDALNLAEVGTAPQVLYGIAS